MKTQPKTTKKEKVGNRNKKKSKVKWELIDKGPDYMRCAIKMTELKNTNYE